MRLLICEVINNVECPGVSIRDVYLCKMENVAGGARLLVSEELKGEGHGGAPRAEGAGLPCSGRLQSRGGGFKHSQVKNWDRLSSPRIDLWWQVRLLLELESTCRLLSQPHTCCCGRRRVSRLLGFSLGLPVLCPEVAVSPPFSARSHPSPVGLPRGRWTPCGKLTMSLPLQPPLPIPPLSTLLSTS